VSSGRTALCGAAAAGHAEAVAALAAAGADVEATDLDGSSPLLLACVEGQLETASLLLDLGADSNRGDRFGFSPLFVAAQVVYNPLLLHTTVMVIRKRVE
jgi:ankyrin repeat protein